MAKTEVAIKEEHQVAAAFDFESDAGAGAENVTVADRKIPMLKILEPLSENLKSKSSKFIPGAKVGDIVDTSINEVIGTEFEFIPVMFKKSFIEWKDKKPVNKYGERSILSRCEWRDIEGQRKGWFLPNGNEVCETAEFYGIDITAGGIWCFIPMSRGRLKAASTFIEKLQRFRLTRADGKTYQPPYFARVWDVGVVDDTSSGGDDYKTWKFTAQENLINARDDGAYWYQEAKLMYEALKEGLANADYDSDVEKPPVDDGIPF